MDVRTERTTLGTGPSHNPHSTAEIAGHPVHPMLIPFPIALFTATFVSDLFYLGTGNTLWVLATEWLLAAGLIMAALAAVAGLTDFLGERRIRNLRASWLHAGGNIAAVLLSILNFFLRHGPGYRSGIGAGEVVLSGIVVLILVFTGWKGWEMVYRDRVGIAES